MLHNIRVTFIGTLTCYNITIYNARIGGKKMAKLKLEIFESNNSITPVSLFIYKVIAKEQGSSIQQFMRSAAGKISYRLSIPVFTDDKRIYSLTELPKLDVDDSFTIVFEKQEVLLVKDNKGIYADLADYYIKENLKTKQRQNAMIC